VHFDAGRYDHHGVASRAATYCRTASGSLPAGANTRRPSASSTVIELGGGTSKSCRMNGALLFGRPRCGRSTTRAVTSNGRSFGSAKAELGSPAKDHRSGHAVALRRRATSKTDTPGSAASATITSFCGSMYCWRAGLRGVVSVPVGVSCTAVPDGGSYLNSHLILGSSAVTDRAGGW
jgi:hypothetical protein